MRFLSTRAHAVMDYLAGALLLLAPAALGFADRNAPGAGIAATLPFIYGILILGQAALTRWEFGLFRTIPVSMHLMVDIVAGAIMLLSPWLFGFAQTVWVPHFIIGLALIGLGMFTRRGAVGAAATADVDRDRRAA
jgi:hypothetical protein